MGSLPRRRPLKREFRSGLNRRLDRTDLAVWLKKESAAPLTVTVRRQR